MLEDLWPKVTDFDDINKLIEAKKELQSESSKEEETGSVQFAKKRAEKLRIKEEKERAAREQVMAEDNGQDELESHEWLVE